MKLELENLKQLKQERRNEFLLRKIELEQRKPKPQILLIGLMWILLILMGLILFLCEEKYGTNEFEKEEFLFFIFYFIIFGINIYELITSHNKRKKYNKEKEELEKEFFEIKEK